MTQAESSERAGRREWLAFSILVLPTLLAAVDLSVLLLALPRLSDDLHPSSVQQLWITDIYGFMVAGFMVTMGRAGDWIGRRRLLMIGGAVFACASIVAAFSQSAGMLIGARAVLGVAGATIAPSTLALITMMFRDPRQRAVAIAGWMSCLVGGNALGPVVGGLLLNWFWWGSVFLIGVPVMLVLLLTARSMLPEFTAEHPGRLDLVSVFMSLAAILPVIYGLKELARAGLATVPLLAIAVGVVFAVLFAVRQRRLADPLLDLGLFFGNRTFSAALSMMLFGGIFLGGLTLLVTQYLQLVKQQTPLHAGLWLLPSIAAMIAGSMSGPIIARRYRPGYVMAVGLTIAAVGYLILTQVDSHASVATLVLGWSVVLGGNGIPAGLGADLVVGAVKPEKAGAAGSIQQTSAELGLALGIAVVGSIAAAVYHGKMSGAIPPGTPPALADAARDNVTGATGGSPALVDAAHSAYASGMSVAAAVSAVVFAALAVLAATALRHVPPYPAKDEAPDAADEPRPDREDSPAGAR
jgi:DHA2 family multidrug resistance protein-like MFS transporter